MGLRLSRRDFDEVSKGQRVVGRHISLTLGAPGTKGAAVVVSKKVARFSVTRHLLKRRVLSVLTPLSKERAIIAYARPGCAALAFPLLKEEIESLLRPTGS